MIRHGGHLWRQHPHVANNLTIGERAADGLKHWFGTWTALGLTGATVGGWLAFVTDPGELRLNLGLSCIAAVQGIILQISANRGDRINAEMALHTQRNTDQLITLGTAQKQNTEELVQLNRRQLTILEELRELRRLLTQELPPAPPQAPGGS